ncbi:hypothetical protein LWS67_22190, partial [Bacillus atrophaeus]|uniref:hypothetical protein n=1 Tax=Bacillus atrophaeus TaxID=1452 RepID=UPI001EFA619D
ESSSTVCSGSKLALSKIPEAAFTTASGVTVLVGVVLAVLGVVGFKVKPFKYSKNFFYSSEALAFKSVVVAVLVSCLLLKEELSLNIIAPFLPLLITVYKSL